MQMSIRHLTILLAILLVFAATAFSQTDDQIGADSSVVDSIAAASAAQTEAMDHSELIVSQRVHLWVPLIYWGLIHSL